MLSESAHQHRSFRDTTPSSHAYLRHEAIVLNSYVKNSLGTVK